MIRRRLLGTATRNWHKSKSGCWSLSLGWRGCRVRVTQAKPGGAFSRVVWIEGIGRRSASLKTADRTEAQHLAEAFLETLVKNDGTVPPDPLTLGELCDRYQQEASDFRTNTKETVYQKRASQRRLLAFFGVRKPVTHITFNDLDRYKVTRGTGRGWPDGRVTRSVRANSVRDDLATLRRMIHWALAERRADGTRLLPENPMAGYRLPREANPNRPLASYDRFLKVLDAMQDLAETAPQERGRVRWKRLALALILAEATGARIGSIRGLRWSDISHDPPSIRWRAEFDKRGRERRVPIPDQLAEALRAFQVELGAIGDGWLFPLADGSGPCNREIFTQQLVVAEEHAGVPHMQGGGWHAYRRKWATERGDLPLKALMVAGGWKDLQTLVTCYQHPSDEELLRVMAHPVKRWERKAGEG